MCGQRITEACGELPAPIMDKLLTLDATELDMLCTHPAGVQQQVAPCLTGDQRLEH